MIIVAIIIYLCMLLFFYNMANKDEEYLRILNRKKTFNKKDCTKILILSLIFLLYILCQKPQTAFICSVTLPYLIISAECDRLTKMVYTTPYYIFVIIAIIIEQITCQNVVILLMFIVAFLMTKTGLLGGGDQGMIILPGVIYYTKYSNATESFLFMFITIMVSEVILYITAVKNKQLDGWFKAKEPIAFGPAMLTGTIIMLFLEEICTRFV